MREYRETQPLPLADPDAQRRAYDRRQRHAFQGWISSRMRSQARTRHGPARTAAPRPIAPGHRG
jgi:hypothetical protein